MGRGEPASFVVFGLLDEGIAWPETLLEAPALVENWHDATAAKIILEEPYISNALS